MHLIQQQDSGLAEYFFDTPLAYATGNATGTQNQVPPGYSTVPTLKYASYASFSSDVTAGRIDPTIRAAAYDPEKWSATPLEEQQNPATYMRLFADLAHQQGYVAIMTPARDLMGVSGAACGQQTGENYSEAFIRCDIAGGAARYSEVFQIQSQALEADPSQFSAFVWATNDQAIAANPNVVVLAGLSTNAVADVDATMLSNAWSSVRGVVAGHYVTISSTSVPTVVVPFLRKVRQAGG
jgi:hypothetical protein